MKRAAFAVIALLAGLCARAAEKPNIVVFLVDDMGFMDTSVAFCRDADGVLRRHPLNEWYRTPNMQRLADRGVRFTDFCAHSVCSPSRVSLMLGQSSARHGTTNWINPYGNNRCAYGPEKWNWEGVKEGDATLPLLMRGAGYRTIMVGKAHFGPFKHFGAEPRNFGFDVNIGGSAIGHPGSYYAARHYGEGTSNPVPHLEKYYKTGEFLTEALTLEALREVDKCAAAKKPFFLYLAHYAVHAPFQSDPRFAAHYAGDGTKSKQAKAFATLIEGMDKSLGDVLDHLEEKGLAGNTLVIFMGDNGSDAPLGGADDIGSSAPVRGKKGSRWEGGVRVPGIVAWAAPSAGSPVQRRFPVKAGGVCSGIAAVYDVLPTCAALAGAALPAGRPVDGISLWPMLAEPGKAGGHKTFLSYFPHEHRSNYFATLREGDWKIHRLYDPSGRRGGVRHELYNLAADPTESNDLAAREPARLKAMEEKLDAEMKAYGALPLGKPAPKKAKKAAPGKAKKAAPGKAGKKAKRPAGGPRP